MIIVMETAHTGTTVMKKKRKMDNDADGAPGDMAVIGQTQPVKWDEVKKARNRINSQRTREREKSQITVLEAERERLWLSNDAIRYQNKHFREAIDRIAEMQAIKRGRPTSLGQGRPLFPETRGHQNTLPTASDMIDESSRALRDSIRPSGVFSHPQVAQLRHASRLAQAQELAYAVAERGADLLARQQHAATMEMQSRAGSFHDTRSAAIDALGRLIPQRNYPAMLINQPHAIGNVSTSRDAMYPFDTAEIRARRLMLQASDLEASIYRGATSEAMRGVFPFLSVRDDARIRFLQEDAMQKELAKASKRNT